MRTLVWWGLICGTWLAAVPGWAAEVYRWVDADGGVHYTAQQPPGHDATRMRLQREPSATSHAAPASRGEEATGDAGPDADTGEPARQPPSPEQLAQLRVECAKARRNIEVLRARPASRYEREDGTYQRYSDAERARMIAESETFIREHCN